MTDSERDIKIAQTKQEVDDFKSIVENFIQEMRDRDNKRDEDIRELRKRQDEAHAKHEADMKEIAKQRETDKAAHDAEMQAINARIDEKFDKLSSQIQNMAIAAVVGVGAIVWAVVSVMR